MSAQEFGEWQVMSRLEQLHPAVLRLRHAQLQAVALQGASKRANGKPWSAAEFMSADPWAEPAAPAARRVNVAAQVRALNARRRNP